MLRFRCAFVAGVLWASGACYEAQTRGEVERERSRDGGEESDSAAPGAGTSSHSIPKRCASLRPPENPSAGLCKTGRLADYCQRGQEPGIRCPQTVEEAIEYVCTSDQPQTARYTLLCNACGGVNVLSTWGFGRYYWSFDAGGELVGATIVDDAQSGPCHQRETIFGVSCATNEDFDEFLPNVEVCP